MEVAEYRVCYRRKTATQVQTVKAKDLKPGDHMVLNGGSRVEVLRNKNVGFDSSHQIYQYREIALELPGLTHTEAPIRLGENEQVLAEVQVPEEPLLASQLVTGDVVERNNTNKLYFVHRWHDNGEEFFRLIDVQTGKPQRAGDSGGVRLGNWGDEKFRRMQAVDVETRDEIGLQVSKEDDGRWTPENANDSRWDDDDIPF